MKWRQGPGKCSIRDDLTYDTISLQRTRESILLFDLTIINEERFQVRNLRQDRATLEEIPHPRPTVSSLTYGRLR